MCPSKEMDVTMEEAQNVFVLPKLIVISGLSGADR
jgi:hypothetical protein